MLVGGALRPEEEEEEGHGRRRGRRGEERRRVCERERGEMREGFVLGRGGGIALGTRDVRRESGASGVR